MLELSNIDITYPHLSARITSHLDIIYNITECVTYCNVKYKECRCYNLPHSHKSDYITTTNSFLVKLMVLQLTHRLNF